MDHSRRHHHLFVSSTDSFTYFPNNSGSDFTIQLPGRLYFRGIWECSLISVCLPSEVEEDIVILCDLCEHSYISNTKLPVLRVLQKGHVNHNGSFNQTMKVQITPIETETIRIYMRTISGKVPTFIDGQVKCTLLLNRII